MNRVVAVLVVVLLSLWLVPAAMSDNGTTQAGYGGESAVQVTLVESGRSTAAATQSLPFTGLDIGVFLAAGAVLVLVGLGMRHLARQRQ